METTIITLNHGEKLLVDFLDDRIGDFYKLLFQTIFKADRINRARLAQGFPEEVQAVIRYQNEDDYHTYLTTTYTNTFRPVTQ